MMMAMTDCVGQEVFIKRLPLSSEQLSRLDVSSISLQYMQTRLHHDDDDADDDGYGDDGGLMYPQSHCNICKLVFIMIVMVVMVAFMMDDFDIYDDNGDDGVIGFLGDQSNQV